MHCSACACATACPAERACIISLQVLSALEDNLRQEQRATCEQEFVTFKHLLTPIQVTLKPALAGALAGCCISGPTS